MKSFSVYLLMCLITMSLFMSVSSLAKDKSEENKPSWFERVFGASDTSGDDDYYEKKNHKTSKNKNKRYKKSERNGPPDHAPAHGYRAKFKHYPDANIYYDTYKDVYYGMKDGKWQPYDSLPSNINLGNGVSVDLEKAIPEVIRAMSQ